MLHFQSSYPARIHVGAKVQNFHSNGFNLAPRDFRDVYEPHTTYGTLHISLRNVHVIFTFCASTRRCTSNFYQAACIRYPNYLFFKETFQKCISEFPQSHFFRSCRPPGVYTYEGVVRVHGKLRREN